MIQEEKTSRTKGVKRRKRDWRQEVAGGRRPRNGWGSTKRPFGEDCDGMSETDMPQSLKIQRGEERGTGSNSGG